MGATLADGGVNPVTGERVVSAATCRYALAVMTTAGLYKTSGDWLYDVGLPGKSGVGGGIVTVAPGKGALGTFAPRLDRAGDGVKGQLATILWRTSAGCGPVPRFDPPGRSAPPPPAQRRRSAGSAIRAISPSSCVAFGLDDATGRRVLP